MAEVAKEKFIKTYRCGNCNNGKVEVTVKLFSDHVTAIVKKCDNCHHQYGIKGVESLEIVS